MLDRTAEPNVEMVRDVLQSSAVRTLAAGSMIGALALVSRGAIAEPDPLRVVYESAGACPDQRFFLSALYTRTHRVRPAVEQESAWTVKVSVRSVNGAALGVLNVDGPNGMTTTREMGGESCEEVVSALALVAALAIDPGADAPSPCPDAPAAKSASLPARRAPSSPTAPRLQAQPPLDAVAAKRAASRSAWMAGAQFVSMGGITPGLSSGAAVHVAREPDSPAVLGLRGRLALAYLPAVSVSDPGGEARFSLAAARVDGCPVRFVEGEFSALSCATLGAGGIHSEGASDRGASATKLWVDVGALERIEVYATEWLLVEGQAGLVAPLVRNTYTFDHPTSQVYRTPTFAGVLGLGLSARLP